MKILGLTGPSGSGKAVVGAAFSSRGIPVLDTDAVYHGWIDTKSACTEELKNAFGENILREDGSVDRRRLAAIVFADDGNKDARLQTLNRITHRYVLESCQKWLHEQKKSGRRAAVIDAPLLIEAELHKKCDAVIAVLAPKEVRLARILLRDGISKEAAEARISSQKPDSFYRAHADFVFMNDGEIVDADSFVETVVLKTIFKE